MGGTLDGLFDGIREEAVVGELLTILTNDTDGVVVGLLALAE